MNLTAVLAAAGIGKRVGADIPKQYLTLLDKTIIEHSLTPFLDHPDIKKVVVSIAGNDLWFKELSCAKHPKIEIVIGGAERVDSVLAALQVINEDDYVLVHDAARPCVSRQDIDKLIRYVTSSKQGAILAAKVADTMKRTDTGFDITETVCRENLWHAQTPQMFHNKLLIQAIKDSPERQKITDEASAMELVGSAVHIIEGAKSNFKVTCFDDLKLAAFYLKQ